MERWLTISFQVGHICRSVGETLLTVHEVLTYGSVNGREALPKGRPTTQATDQDGIEREAREGAQSSPLSEDRNYAAEARSGSSGYPSSVEADAKTPQIITSTPSNGQADVPIADLIDLAVELEQEKPENGNVKESAA